MILIDTAEMYPNGAAEELVGEAIAGRRNQVFLVSKLLPNQQLATRRSPRASAAFVVLGLATLTSICFIRGEKPRWKRRAAFHSLARSGKIQDWGVSNFDISDMQELIKLTQNDLQLLDHAFPPPTKSVPLEIL